MYTFRAATAATVCGLLTTAVLAGTAPTTLAAGSSASRVVLHDGAGDVQRMVPPDTSSHPFGDFPLADVTTAVVAHGAHAVFVQQRFVDIRRVGTQLYWLDVATPGQHHYRVTLTSRPGARQGVRVFEKDDVAARCRGFTRNIDYQRNLVTVRVARSCLGSPRWVRVQALNTFERKDGRPLYIDNPHNHTAMGGPTKRLVRG